MFWPWGVFLLYAVLFSREADGVQVPHRESSEMVTTGDIFIQVAFIFVCKLTGLNIEPMLFNVIAGGQAQRAPH